MPELALTLLWYGDVRFGLTQKTKPSSSMFGSIGDYPIQFINGNTSGLIFRAFMSKFNGTHQPFPFFFVFHTTFPFYRVYGN